MDGIRIRRIIEALLVSSEEPLSIEQIQQVTEGVSPSEIKDEIEQLKQEYIESQRSFKINEVAGGYLMATKEEYAPFLRKLYKSKHVERLSRPALETLAIVAYKQPVTRLDIESIRGVNVDGVLKSLLEKGLIKMKGRKEVVGRPYVYGTGKVFLKYFGLNSIEDLPDIEEFKQTADEAFRKREEAN
jgi:segregation and condensation protein B